MPNPRHQRVRAILEELRHAPAEERERRLLELLESAPQVHAEVASLLDYAELDDHGLTRGPHVEPSELQDTTIDAEADSAGIERIADFRIVRRIGAGGMGLVFEAVQDSPRRTVALKVMRFDGLNPSSLARFRQEAQLLAQLSHPGIAKVYASGTFPHSGVEQPYFAMELVDGRPLGEYARTNNLSSTERLELFCRLADAVEYAHTRGVIHRDLKPENVLVVEQQGSALGRPVVLDFGVARATDSDLQLTTVQTDVGQLIGTLPYMSPEQLEAEPDKIDARSDVYALGVVLFQLLSDRLPHDLRGRSIPDAIRLLLEHEPDSVASIDTVFRGDVDTIVSKALSKERERRYQSVGAMAADIRRYLASEPILGRPATTWYQLNRFCRRNRVLVSSLVAIFLLTLAALVLVTGQMFRARRAEASASTRLEEVTELADFYDSVLLTIRNRDAGPDITVREMIDGLLETLETDLPENPIVRARILFTVGSIERDLGRRASGATFMKRSWQLRREALGDGDSQTVKALLEYAMCRLDQPDGDAVLADLEQGLQFLDSTDANDKYAIAATYGEIANFFDNDPENYDKAQVAYDQAFAIAAQVDAPESTLRVTLHSNYGLFLSRQGKFEDAEREINEAIRLAESDETLEGRQVAHARSLLGGLYVSMDRLEEAELELRRASDWNRKNLGRDFVGTNMVDLRLADLLGKQGHPDKGLEVAELALEGLVRNQGPEHRYTLRAELTRIGLLERLDRHAEGLARLDELEPRVREIHGHSSYWSQQLRLARTRLAASPEPVETEGR